MTATDIATLLHACYVFSLPIIMGGIANLVVPPLILLCDMCYPRMNNASVEALACEVTPFFAGLVAEEGVGSG